MLLKTALIVVLLSSLMGPLSGRAAHYSPSWGDWRCPPTQKCGIAARQGVQVPAGYTPIAHWDCRSLGRRGSLWLDGRGPLRVIVADCTAAEDLETVLRRGIVAEVPYAVAVEYGFAGGSIDAVLILETATSPPARWSPLPPSQRCRPL